MQNSISAPTITWRLARGCAREAHMAKKARKKAASKSRTKRAKPGTTVRAKSSVGSRARLKARTKASPRRAAGKRKLGRTPAPPPPGIIARMENAIHAVVDGIRETAAMRDKLQRPGSAETT